MGYMRHHAIIVTSWDEDGLVEARGRAVQLFGPDLVTGLVESSRNMYRTFFVGPDGSKEGWDVSDDGDAARDAFVLWLNSRRYPEDGSSCLTWCEVQYGDDEDDNRMTRDEASCRPRQERQEAAPEGAAQG